MTILTDQQQQPAGERREGGGGGRDGEQKDKKRKESILDLSKYLDKAIRVKFSGGREASGILKGFDQLLNLVLDNTIEYLRGGPCLLYLAQHSLCLHMELSITIKYKNLLIAISSHWKFIRSNKCKIIMIHANKLYVLNIHFLITVISQIPMTPTS